MKFVPVDLSLHPCMEVSLSVYSSHSFIWIPHYRMLGERPRMIEALRGRVEVKVAAGGAHSAAITDQGELYTWGKGRYGRLGHGDSDDQMRPKLVEALKGRSRPCHM